MKHLTDDIVVNDVSLSPARDRRLVVRGVSFHASPGRPVTVLGPTGSGKSTLLAAIALRTPKEGGPEVHGGDIRVLGTSVLGLGPIARTRLLTHIGYAPQHGSERLMGSLTVADVVAEPIFARDARFDRSEAGAQVAGAVDRMRLPLGFLSRRVFELSRGQRQRVALAQALVLGPKALIVDDPVSGLDPLVRPDILESLRELSETCALVAVVRTPEQARAIGGEAVVMERGAVVGAGPIDAQLDDPRHPYVAALARA